MFVFVFKINRIINQITCSNKEEDIALYLLFLTIDLQAIYTTQSCTSMLYMSYTKETYDSTIPILLHLSNIFPYLHRILVIDQLFACCA